MIYFCMYDPITKQTSDEQKYKDTDPIIPYLREGFKLQERGSPGWVAYWGKEPFTFPE